MYCSLIPSRCLYIDIIYVLFSYTHDMPPRDQLEAEKIRFISFLPTHVTHSLELNFKQVRLFFTYTQHIHLEVSFDTRKIKVYLLQTLLYLVKTHLAFFLSL